MSQRLRDVLAAARQAFSEFLPPQEAEREARLLLCDALGLNSAQLLARLDDTLPVGEGPERFAKMVDARQRRQPLSQILGETEFYGRMFHVTPDVLTPRPDTETLIDLALSDSFTRVLDLGTGSGCILATLLAERPGAEGVGVDVSEDALAVASQNTATHGVADRTTLLVSDWFDAVEGQFDLVVSNPPYIAAAEMSDLAPEVVDWEPHLALTPGNDGLSCYRQITQSVLRFLVPGGRLLVEIGHTQGPAVYRLLEEAGLDPVLLHADINGHDRVVGGHMP